jgi:hypothetical protein
MNRSARCSCVILGLAIPVFTGACTRGTSIHSANETDNQVYLEAPRFADFADNNLYDGIVGELFAAPVDALGRCFSMASIVTGKPEEMVYVTCAVEGTDNAVVVGHIVASESIQDTLRVSGVEAARHVPVRQTEAPFSFDDARVLRSISIQLLGRAKVKTGFPLVREVWKSYFFSAVREGHFQGQYGGTTQNPTPGSAAAQLVELAQVLAQIADEGDTAGQKAFALRSLARAKAAKLADVAGVKPE